MAQQIKKEKDCDIESDPCNIDIEEESTKPYLPYEILGTFEEFKVSEKQRRGNDFFFPITYYGKRCQIQTPVCMVVFGLNEYSNPDSKIIKYSLHLSIKDDNNECTEFLHLLKEMDELGKSYLHNKEHIYCSSLRHNIKEPRKTPLLQLKVPSEKDLILIDIHKNNSDQVLYCPTKDEFNKLLPHRTIVKAIIEVNPLWYAGKKFGISYRLLKIKVMERSVRNIEFR